MGIKVNATDIAKPFREDVKAQIQELKKAGIGKQELVRMEQLAVSRHQQLIGQERGRGNERLI
jgi:hypothetical protein